MRLTPTQPKPVRTPAVRAGGQHKKGHPCANFFRVSGLLPGLFNKIFTSTLLLPVCDAFIFLHSRDLSEKAPEQFQIYARVMLRTQVTCVQLLLLLQYSTVYCS